MKQKTMNEEERYQYFMRNIPDTDRKSVDVIVKHVKSGKSVKISTEGQIIYHTINKAINLDVLRKEIFIPSRFSETEDDIFVQSVPCHAKPFKGFQFWCDETGILKQLPVNEKATTLFLPQIYGHVLVGNILISP